MGTKITRQQFEERVRQIHPFSKIQILDYDKIKAPMTYKCQICGRVYKINTASDIFSRLNPCICHKSFYSREAKIHYFESQQNSIEVIGVNGDKTYLTCKTCGYQFERTTVSVMTNFESCPNCNNRFDKQKNTIFKVEQLLREQFPGHHYEVLDYEGCKGKVEIKCLDCHFVYKGDFASFRQSRGCPRCHRKQSKGEEKIKRWLQEEEIIFMEQKSLDLQFDTHRYKFDFYLPDYSLAIEYNGEQHYIRKKGKFEDLSIIQARDEVKKNYCKKWGIELFIIPYWDYNDIEKILNKKFNDYPERE